MASVVSGESVFMDVMLAMNGSGQQLADEIDNTTRNGCFEHCDGWPDELSVQLRGIVDDAISLGGKEEVDAAAKEALMERARRHSDLIAAVDAACRAECLTGAFGLFENDSDLFDSNGDPVIRTCPIKQRLSEVVINFAANEAKPPQN